MEAIYYDEAAQLLGITSGALRHAVSGNRRALTLLPRQGQKQRLIKEQVMLFKNKRLSLSALTQQERQKWQEYANGASAPRVQPDDIRAIVQQELAQELAPVLEEMSDLDTEEAIAKSQLATIQGKKAGYRKALSLLRARADTLAPAI